jgi:PAS domain-containing protein
MEELRTKLDATERRFQEANEILQAQIAERKRAEETFGKAQKYTENIVKTIREPLLVLSADLKVISANQSFYQTFKVTPKETEGRFIYSIGNHLVVLKDREIIVERVDGSYKAAVSIGGKYSILKKVYVKSKEGLIGVHKVFYIDLFGWDIQTNLSVRERIFPDHGSH